jgi:acetyl esterase/lipase
MGIEMSGQSIYPTVEPRLCRCCWLHTITCPILFLQGGADNPFRRSDGRLGCELLRAHGLPTAYFEIETGDHTLGNVPREGADAVPAWLQKITFLR